jgi:coenzyme F420 hydrogenase subunit beta
MSVVPLTLDQIVENGLCIGCGLCRSIAGSDQVDRDTAVRDPVWGSAERSSIGYAGDPVVRFRGSTGGVLTALGQFLLTSGRVKFILHVAASKSAPMRSERRLSFVPRRARSGQAW